MTFFFFFFLSFSRSNTRLPTWADQREDYANVTRVSSRFKLRSTVDARESVVDVSDIRHSGATRAFRNRFFPPEFATASHKCITIDSRMTISHGYGCRVVCACIAHGDRAIRYISRNVSRFAFNSNIIATITSATIVKPSLVRSRVDST